MAGIDGEAAPKGGPPTLKAPRQARADCSTPLKLRRHYELVAVPGELAPLVRAWVAHRERRLKLESADAAERWVDRLGHLAELEARIERGAFP